MEQIREEVPLPRFYKEFIGIGHQLEHKRKERRKIELQERAVANRVLFLEKEEVKAEKSLSKKRQRLGSLIKIAERQAQQKQQKEQLLLEREREVQLAREENHLRRMLHRQNRERQEQQVLQRNSLDYRVSREVLREGEARKKQQQREHLLQRQERYLTLNARKEQGRSRIDRFFQKKNFEHTQLYRSKIAQEESRALQKKDTIKKLTQIEEVLRKRLETTSQRVSQLDLALGQYQEMRTRSRSKSRLSLSKTFDHSPDPPSLITSVEGELLLPPAEGPEQADNRTSEDGRVRHRRRNKHANRYSEYEQF